MTYEEDGQPGEVLLKQGPVAEALGDDDLGHPLVSLVHLVGLGFDAIEVIRES